MFHTFADITEIKDQLVMLSVPAYAENLTLFWLRCAQFATHFISSDSLMKLTRVCLELSHSIALATSSGGVAITAYMSSL